MTIRPLLRHSLSACAAAALMATTPAHAHGANPSDASALSLLPIAVSVAAPAMVLSAGAVFTVVAVEASASGTLWILERASDGARMTLRLSGGVAAGASLGVAAAVTVSAVTTGWILVSAGRAIAFVPNEVGR
ncbi:MAG TPA: hypothetical protein VF606_09335, partial [Geminicoccaceae bacterium]